MSETKIVTATIKQAFKLLLANIKADVPTVLFGQPGAGKTSIGMQAFEKVNSVRPYYAALYVWSTTNRNAIDLGGLYRVNTETGKTERCPISELVLDKPVFVIIDELGDCPAFEQSSYYRTFLEREVGDKKLCAGSYVMGCTNRPDDNAAARELSAAIKGRGMCITIRVDRRSTLEFAIDNSWSDTLRGFIAACGSEYLESGFDPDAPYAGCTPRDLGNLHKLEKSGVLFADLELAELQIIGCLDHRAGKAYLAFRQLQIPAPQLVFDTPKTAPLLDGGIQFAYQAAIVGNAIEANLPNVLLYALRLNRVDGCSLCWELKRKFPQVVKLAKWVDVCLAYQDLV